MLEPPVPMIMGIARSFVSETVSMSPSIEATSSLILAAVLAEEVASPTTVMMPPCLSTLTLSAPGTQIIALAQSQRKHVWKHSTRSSTE